MIWAYGEKNLLLFLHFAPKKYLLSQLANTSFYIIQNTKIS